MVSAEKIDDYIRRNKMTDRGFESLCGLSNSVVYQWRKGIVKPGLKVLMRIADATGIPLMAWLDD